MSAGTVRIVNDMLEAGLKAESGAVVTASVSAAEMGSGDLPVLATPAMIALMENAAMIAVAGDLPEGSTTVGAMMNTTHIRPTAIGDTVTASAVLTAVEGRKLTFRVEARDSVGLVGEGDHIRYVVDRAKFLSKLDRRPDC